MNKDPKSGWRRSWSADTWISCVATVIAILALGFAISEGRTARQHQRLMALPWLDSTFHYDEKGVRIMFGNVGLGPAVLKWFQIKVDGKPQQDWPSFGRALGLAGQDEWGFLIPYPNSLQVTDSLGEIFRIEPGPMAQQFVTSANRIGIKACYCSLFNECWLMVGKGQPQPVESCEPVPEVILGLHSMQR